MTAAEIGQHAALGKNHPLFSFMSVTRIRKLILLVTIFNAILKSGFWSSISFPSVLRKSQKCTETSWLPSSSTIINWSNCQSFFKLTMTSLVPFRFWSQCQMVSMHANPWKNLGRHRIRINEDAELCCRLSCVAIEDEDLHSKYFALKKALSSHRLTSSASIQPAIASKNRSNSGTAR